MKSRDKRDAQYRGTDFGAAEQKLRMGNESAGRLNNRRLPLDKRPAEVGLPMALRISLTQRRRKNKITLAEHA